ncbi:MAG: chalcone isomerase family protein [Myxococcota bacterium]
MSKLVALFAVALSMAVTAPAFAKRCEGISMDDNVTVGGNQLVLNGMGIREATVFSVNVYIAGLYLPEATDSPRTILNNDTQKRLVMRFVRDVGRDDMDEAIREGFGDVAERHSAAITRFSNFFPEEITDGTTITFDYVPGTGLSVKVGNRNRGTIRGAGFARAFFRIFVGPNPPNRGLKRGLLGGECG